MMVERDSELPHRVVSGCEFKVGTQLNRGLSEGGRLRDRKGTLMATAGTFGNIDATVEHATNAQPNASFAEQGFMIAAMCGAVLGAFTGSTLAVGTGIPPELLGLFGIIVGSPIVAAGWSLLVQLTSRTQH